MNVTYSQEENPFPVEGLKIKVCAMNFTLTKRFGGGASSQVWLAEAAQDDTKYRLACKVIPLSTDFFNEMLAKSHAIYLERYMKREIKTAQLLMQYPHENIVKMFNITHVKDKWLLFFMALGKCNLLQWAAKNRPHGLHEEEARCVFRQLVSAINHLHSCLGIAHRDLKLENVLVHGWKESEDGHVHLNIRLGDLGFCRQGRSVPVTGGTIWYQMCQSQCGTMPYCPPEIIMDDSYNPFKADVFSLAAVLFFMITSRMPFKVDDQLKNSLQPEAQKASWKLSREVKLLLEGILQPEPQKRLSLTEILKNSWFRRKCSYDVITF